MKNFRIILAGASMALAGCGMTDPWEKYEDYGEFPDRLLPSELKTALCGSEAWKLTYRDTDFYFSFSEDGTVVCNSNMFRDEISSTYRFDWDNPESVLLTIPGGGHFQYLENNGFGQEITVTSYSDKKFSCKDSQSEEEYTAVAVQASDIDAVNESKLAVKKSVEGGWSATYSENLYYLLFADNGIVACLPENAVASNTEYTFSGTVSDPVLEMKGFSYFGDTSFGMSYENGGTTMKLTGKPSGKVITFSQTDASVIEEAGKAVISEAFVSNNYTHGVVRSTSGLFYAHYVAKTVRTEDAEIIDEIKFDILHNRVLTHKTVKVSDIDIYGNIKFRETVSINGKDIDGFVYNLSNNTVSADDRGMDVTANNTVVDWLVNGFKTYVIRPSSLEKRGDMSDNLMKEFDANTGYWDKLEISDRGNRPFIFTPKGGNFGGRTWTCFYSANSNPLDGIRTDEVDKVRFDRPYTVKNIYGGGINAEHIAEIERFYPGIMNAYYHEDGLYVILEGGKNEDNSQLYLISPTSGNWFKCDRDM